MAGVAVAPAGPASIREASQVDLLWVVGAIERCFAEVGLSDHGLSYDRRSAGRFLLTLMLSGQGNIWVAELDDTPVGLRVAQLAPYPFNSQVLIASGLLWYVEPEARALGIGEQLFACFERWAREQGARSIQVMPLAYKGSTRGFFEKRGYVLVEEHFLKELGDDDR